MLNFVPLTPAYLPPTVGYRNSRNCCKGYQWFPLDKPGVGYNLALHAAPADRMVWAERKTPDNTLRIAVVCDFVCKLNLKFYACGRHSCLQFLQYCIENLE